eukprot:jgi/Mesen1/516/ME000104S10607
MQLVSGKQQASLNQHNVDLCSARKMPAQDSGSFGSMLESGVQAAQKTLGRFLEQNHIQLQQLSFPPNAGHSFLSGKESPLQPDSRSRRRRHRSSGEISSSRRPSSVEFMSSQGSSPKVADLHLASTSTKFAPGKEPLSGEDTGIIRSTQPTAAQFLKHPVALFHFVPKDGALFVAGAVAGAVAKSITAPLDRVKLQMQVAGVQVAKEGAKKISLLGAFVKIFNEEGAAGYWKGNMPQVLRIIPYSAVQLFAYESYKKIFQGTDAELSVPARLAAGACAGMTSTLVTYPLDVLRLRLAVDPLSKSMSKVALNMLRDEGAASFYKGLGPSLLGIAPYIAINFCVFDLIKKSMPEDFRKKPIASFVTALAASTVATVTCYPLDTVRRQLQMKNTPYKSVLDAIPGILARDGVPGLYRGFLANALKNLPNSSIRLTTYDAAKNLIGTSKVVYDSLVQERKAESEAPEAPQQS